MVKVTDKDYYMDGYLSQNIGRAKEVIKKDWDMVFCIDGSEGTGKSVLAMQIGYYCDNTLDISRIVFTPEEFKSAILHSEKYQAVVYDEAYTGLSSRATMTLINRTLISMLAEIRQKNLFVFVVMPTFFDLDKYVALWRSRLLIHVYTGKNFERGYFAFYDADKKKQMYVNGKKFYSYGRPNPNFIGRFTNFYPVDEEKYKIKKRNSLINREQVIEDKEKQKEVDAAMLIRLFNLSNDVPHKVRYEMLGMPKATYFRKLREYKENNTE